MFSLGLIAMITVAALQGDKACQNALRAADFRLLNGEGWSGSVLKEKGVEEFFMDPVTGNPVLTKVDVSHFLKISIVGDRVVIKDGNTEHVGKLSLDFLPTAKVFQLSMIEGPHKGTSLYGIYRFSNVAGASRSGNSRLLRVLEICIGLPGQARPSKFVQDVNKSRLILLFPEDR